MTETQQTLLAGLVREITDQTRSLHVGAVRVRDGVEAATDPDNPDGRLATDGLRLAAGSVPDLRKRLATIGTYLDAIETLNRFV